MKSRSRFFINAEYIDTYLSVSLPSTTMSTTTTTTETKAPAELTILYRLGKIPLVTFSLQSIDGALSNNAYTRGSYSAAKELSKSAIKRTEPLQTRLAPIISQADGIANKACDAVESRYPYPFKAKPEEVATAIQEQKQHASDFLNGAYSDVNKKIDTNIRTPAINAATSIDKRFSPLVDYYEVAVRRTNSSEAGPSTPPDAKYQYQRAISLSKTLKDNIYVYSNEQYKQLQAQNVLVQRARETAHAINNLATTSITSASHQIHGLSDSMVLELQKLQNATASFSTSIRDSAAQLQNQIPPQIQQTYMEVTNNLAEATSELRKIISKENITLQGKISLVGHEVQNRVSPMLDTIKKGVSELLLRGREVSSDSAPPRANGA
ncbi:hypothetical protein H2248_012430 [Termitomyces sp. 'cryptogamus']|nr:hypothetical protein H2248_012430 [Termitomyces sp. 'cryptogamus']